MAFGGIIPSHRDRARRGHQRVSPGRWLIRRCLPNGDALSSGAEWPSIRTGSLAVGGITSKVNRTPIQQHGSFG